MRPSSPEKRLPILVAAFLAVALALAPAALAGTIFPESGGSEQADDIRTLYAITFWIGVVVFVGVEGALVYSLVRYRRRRHGPAPQQIRGNTPLEIGWTLGAAAIVLVLIGVTFVYLPDIENPPRGGAGAPLVTASVDQPPPPGGRTLEIGVNGQQYLWRFDYPGERQLFTYHRMVVPEDTTVILNVTASDVIHSWWAPKLGGKVDGVPGHVNETWFKADEPGFFRAVCAELCGDNHADMRAEVEVVTVEQFNRWAEQQRRELRAAQTGLAEQRRAREAREAQGRQRLDAEEDPVEQGQ